MPETTAKPIYCPRRQQHAAVCETPNACAGGADCRFGPDLNTCMNDTPSVSNTTNGYNQAAFDLIVGLRGGLPEKCDFCDQPFTGAARLWRSRAVGCKRLTNGDLVCFAIFFAAFGLGCFL